MVGTTTVLYWFQRRLHDSEMGGEDLCELCASCDEGTKFCFSENVKRMAYDFTGACARL